MRVYQSWPEGSGRRGGVSLGPVGLILFGLFVMPFVLIGWLVWFVVQVGVWIWREWQASRQ